MSLSIPVRIIVQPGFHEAFSALGAALRGKDRYWHAKCARTIDSAIADYQKAHRAAVLAHGTKSADGKSCAVGPDKAADFVAEHASILEVLIDLPVEKPFVLPEDNTVTAAHLKLLLELIEAP